MRTAGLTTGLALTFTIGVELPIGMIMVGSFCPIFLTVTRITHFFMCAAFNMSLVLPLFFPVMRIFFFITFTAMIFLPDTFAFTFRLPVFFTLTVTCPPPATGYFCL